MILGWGRASHSREIVVLALSYSSSAVTDADETADSDYDCDSSHSLALADQGSSYLARWAGMCQSASGGMS